MEAFIHHDGEDMMEQFYFMRIEAVYIVAYQEEENKAGTKNGYNFQRLFPNGLLLPVRPCIPKFPQPPKMLY